MGVLGCDNKIKKNIQSFPVEMDDYYSYTSYSMFSQPETWKPFYEEPQHSMVLSAAEPKCRKNCKGCRLNLHQNQKFKRKPETKLYSCACCEKSFKRKADCIRHGRIHTGEKPYKCLGCNEAFARQDALRRHQGKGSAACASALRNQRYVNSIAESPAAAMLVRGAPKDYEMVYYMDEYYDDYDDYQEYITV